MNIQAYTYDFFFHPFHKDHSGRDRLVSIITSVALSILTCGVYAAVFCLVQIAERFSIEGTNEGMQKINKVYIGNDALKAKQKNHLAKLEALVKDGHWEHLQKHTDHPFSGFDWWMFPTDRASLGQGSKYQVCLRDITSLKKDQEFMDSYRKGVVLVAKSWGFDLENKKDVTSSSQKWVGYNVRLGKMLYSLKLFNQTDLFNNLVYFIDKKGLRSKLDEWIIDIITD